MFFGHGLITNDKQINLVHSTWIMLTKRNKILPPFVSLLFFLYYQSTFVIFNYATLWGSGVLLEQFTLIAIRWMGTYWSLKFVVLSWSGQRLLYEDGMSNVGIFLSSQGTCTHFSSPFQEKRAHYKKIYLAVKNDRK